MLEISIFQFQFSVSSFNFHCFQLPKQQGWCMEKKFSYVEKQIIVVDVGVKFQAVKTVTS